MAMTDVKQQASSCQQPLLQQARPGELHQLKDLV
jgi:hypothetical protein